MTALECVALKEVWKERVQEFRMSGLSGRQWCAHHGLKVNQLHYWNRKFSAPDADASEARWVALDLSSAADRTEEALVVSVGPATITVHPGFDPAFLQSLVRALGAC